MKRFMLAAALALTLGGCFQTVGPTPPVVVVPPAPSPVVTPIEEKIIDLREKVFDVCKFVPAADFLVKLVTNNMTVGMITEYAYAICKVAQTPTRAAGSRYVVKRYPGTVNGVQVVGRFSN